jgi:aminoglycoside phosphotransferase (APT) family kinase protein
MHGDYQFANVMYRHGAPATLAAIVDWEMGTVGDPKLDLAWALHSWPDGDDAGPQAIAYVDMTGMPRRTELLEHFARTSGRQVEDMDYYFVLAKWKLALMLEQTFQRAKPGSPLESFGTISAALMREAADLAGSSDYGRLAAAP